MPRDARIKSEIGIYHVMQRGINRQTIFEDDEDCEKYLQCLRECKVKSGFDLYAYSLMGNHIHLLIREDREPLGQIFKRLGAGYVYWYNWKYKRSGHLFQDRFKSEPINDDKQFIAVLRYIYQNAVNAGLCNNPEEYQWSSYRLLGKENPLIDSSGITEIIPIDQLRNLTKETTEEQFLELTPDRRMTDREAAGIIKIKYGVNNIVEYQKMNPEKQEEYIKALNVEGCSIRQITRVTGISKARVERILK